MLPALICLDLSMELFKKLTGKSGYGDFSVFLLVVFLLKKKLTAFTNFSRSMDNMEVNELTLMVEVLERGSVVVQRKIEESQEVLAALRSRLSVLSTRIAEIRQGFVGTGAGGRATPLRNYVPMYRGGVVAANRDSLSDQRENREHVSVTRSGRRVKQVEHTHDSFRDGESSETVCLQVSNFVVCSASSCTDKQGKRKTQEGE